MRRLAIVRRLKGLTQQELADKAGMFQSQIALYETGNTTLNQASAEIAKKIADVLGVSIEEILEVERDEK